MNDNNKILKDNLIFNRLIKNFFSDCTLINFFLIEYNEALKNSIIYFNKYKMPENIRFHSITVGKIALYLLISGVFNLIDKLYLKYFINYSKDFKNNITLKNSLKKYIKKIFQAAFLHDIGKIYEIKVKEKKNNYLNHAFVGEKILINEGLFFEAKFCRIHLIADFLIMRESIFKLLNLADKLVMHSEVVSIKERFCDLKKRYPAFNEFFNKDIENIYLSYFKSLKPLNFENFKNYLNSQSIIN